MMPKQPSHARNGSSRRRGVGGRFEPAGSLYENLACSEGRLGGEIQKRIHQYALRHKHAELAAALARRGDLLEEIDRELSTWGEARVLAAWYKNPKRGADQVREKIAKERRITVLEAVAGLDGLDPSVYEVCAGRISVKVALALLGNPAARNVHQDAAAYMATMYETLGYETKDRVVRIIEEGGREVLESFILACGEIYTVKDVIGVQVELGDNVAEHIHTVCQQSITEALERKAVMATVTGNQANRYYHWDKSHYRNLTATTIEVLARFAWVPGDRSACVTRTVAVLKEMAVALIGERQDPQDAALMVRVEACVEAIEGDGGIIETVIAAREAQDPDALERVLDSLSGGENGVGLVLNAVLSSPHVDVRTAYRAGSMMRWRGVDIRSFLSARKQTYNPSAIGAIMVASWNTDDGLITEVAGVHPGEVIWAAVIEAYMLEHTSIPRNVLESKYATSSVLAKLPLSVLTQADAPRWLVRALVEYLEENLNDIDAWDDFEVLLARHRGSIEQLVRAARTSTRSRGRPT